MIYGLSDSDVDRLRALLLAFEQGRLTQQPDPRPGPPAERIWSRLAKATANIPGMGAQPGSGPIEWYNLPIGGGALSDSGFGDGQAQNIGPPIPSGAILTTAIEPIGGNEIIGPVWGRIGQASGTITALSGSTPGSGSAILQSMPAGGGALTSTGQTVTVYSLCGSSIANGSYVVLLLEPASGNLVVTGVC